MVRKSLGCTLLLLALSCALSCSAAALSVYPEGNISSTYVTMFEGLVGKISPLDDYVFFRSGQYEYTFVYGDLSLGGSNFSGSDVDVVQVSYSSGYNATYDYTTSSLSSFTLNAGSTLVYSNLGSYPILGEVVSYEIIQAVLFCIIALCLFIRPIFAFVLRNKQ